MIFTEMSDEIWLPFVCLRVLSLCVFVDKNCGRKSTLMGTQAGDVGTVVRPAALDGSAKLSWHLALVAVPRPAFVAAVAYIDPWQFCNQYPRGLRSSGIRCCGCRGQHLMAMLVQCCQPNSGSPPV